VTIIVVAAAPSYDERRARSSPLPIDAGPGPRPPLLALITMNERSGRAVAAPGADAAPGHSSTRPAHADVVADPIATRLAERVSAASYGTVLVLAALAVVEASDVASGWGWELVTGVGLATWVAHLYAEVVGDHLRHRAAHEVAELKRAMADGSPIILAAVLPAVVLGLGRLGVIADRVALWAAVGVAFVQLVGLGAFVGWAASPRHSKTWLYAGVTAAFGAIVVSLKVALGH
jgi:hypothetical protein